ncbi:hypothetical protein GRJ93_004382 [Salmonella enterica]|nr:hypothetical protein [Salmonella enterica]EDQ8692260.1 hypothetical protein [Salmonella enterica]EGA2677635.1 hypothetical protein [Salmonella enterica]
MANLPETPQWEEGIYQIEVSDPVLGGPDGISNRQGKQLASRTLYLKQQVEKGGTDLAKHIAAADPHTQYAPKASPTFTGTPTAPTPANSDNSKKLATTEFVAKALAALAGSAPETLDTLKELADALGNDPNFATTVLNQLAEKLAKDQNGADIPDPALFVKNLGLTETVEQARNAVPSTRKVNGKALTTDITLTSGDIGALPVTGGKLNGPLGIGTDNALGGNSIVLGDNDTGFKQDGDGILGIYANNALVGYIDNSGLHMSVDVLSNGAIRAGNAKKLSLTSNNNSTMTATFNLWGDANRPTVIELDDDQGWHLYSQRNPDGSIVFTVNGDITANTLRAGEAIYQNNGDIFGSAWGGWLSKWVNNNFVRAVRLGPQAISGGLWRDYQLGGGNVVTGFHTDGSWEMEGDDDKVYYRPVQFLVGGTWITASSV